MKIEDLKKTKEELEKQREENDEKISLYDERTRMANVNSFENRAITTLGLSVLGYLPSLFTFSALIKNIGITSITNIIPALSYPLLVVGGSFGIGTLLNSLINKKYKTKERYKAFSTAKTRTEKIEEEVHYQIELEKANNRNKAIDEALKVLESNQAILSRMSNRYDLNDKTAPQTREEAETKVNGLSSIIKEQYDKLDVLTTQKVLHDNFWRIRSKFYKRVDIILFPMVAGAFAMWITGIPFMLIRNVITYSSLVSIPITLGSFIIGSVAVSGYVIKKCKEQKEVFNKFNSQLGENSLVERYEKFEGAYEEQQELKSLIEAQIRDISLAEVQLQENKRHLDSFLTEEDKRRIILEQPFPQLKITDKTREDVLEHPERYTNCDVRVVMGKFYTDEEYEQRRNEVLNQPLPGDEEKKTTLGKKRILRKNNGNK